MEPLYGAKREVLNLLMAMPGKAWSVEELAEATTFKPRDILNESPVLKNLGVVIETERDKWYWPAQMCDLDARVLMLLVLGRMNEVVVLEETDSTNTWIKTLLLEERADTGTTVVAKRQTKGKGSRGRGWSSPLGGLWFSTVLGFTRELTEVTSFSLVAALSIAQVLTRTAVKTEVKWPNDIVIKGKKVGGILLELGKVSGKISYVVLGVGINVNNVLADLPREVRDGAATLREITARMYSLNHLLSQILVDLNKKYQVFEQEGFAPFYREYLDLLCHVNREVQIQIGKSRMVGWSEGITSQGHLILKTAAGERRIISSADIFL